MNNVLNTMVSLQHHNDAIIRERSEIEKANKKLKDISENRSKREKDLSTKKSELLYYKKKMDQSELELKTVETKIDKIQAKLNEATNQKEYEAGESEKNKAVSIKDVLEEEILNGMEDLSQKEMDLEKLNIENKELFDNEEMELTTLEERINRFSSSLSNHENEFSTLLEKLPRQHLSRFKKLAQSRDGVALVELNSNSCGGCNFAIPSADLNKIKSGEIINCTNCGRFVTVKIPR
jgi:predicted  nucleic acid-binding Zn-ribbon protein